MSKFHNSLFSCPGWQAPQLYRTRTARRAVWIRACVSWHLVNRCMHNSTKRITFENARSTWNDLEGHSRS